MARKKGKVREWPVIRKIVVPDGTSRWELDTGSVVHPRVRKRFWNEQEALSLADKLRSQRQRSGLRSFSFTDTERQDAKDALEKLKPLGVSLSDAADFYLHHARPPEGDIDVRRLVDLYLDRARQRNLRDRSIADIRSRLEAFVRTYGERLTKTMGAHEIESWIRSGVSARSGEGIKDQTFRNHRTVLHGLFKFAESRGFIAEGTNPIKKIETPHIDREPPPVLSIAQCRRLLRACQDNPEWELGPYITLGMFCGLRSAELSLIDWEQVDIFQKHVVVPATIAKKRRIRIVDIPDNALEWLSTYGIKKRGPILPPGFPKRFAKLVKLALNPDLDEERFPILAKATVKEWPANGLRHTAGSMHYAAHKDSAATCAMLGQKNDDVLFNHYRSMVTSKHARLFYSLRPVQEEQVSEARLLDETA